MGELINNKPKLICIPYAGGTATSYQQLSTCLGEQWEIVVTDPPGHGSNTMPLIDNLESLVSYYLDLYQEHFTSSFALFGYSMGGKIVHRMAQELEERDVHPLAVFISSMYSPNIVPQRLAHLEKNLFLKHLLSLGGIQKELLEHEEFVNYFLPIIRADFKAVEEHLYENKHIINTPMHVFVGLQDERATPDSVHDWTKWAHQISFSYFDAGHMFLSEYADLIAKKVTDVCALKSDKVAII